MKINTRGTPDCDKIQAIYLSDSSGRRQNVQEMENSNVRTKTAPEEERVTSCCTQSPIIYANFLPCVSVLPCMQIKVDGQEEKTETDDEHDKVAATVTTHGHESGQEVTDSSYNIHVEQNPMVEDEV